MARLDRFMPVKEIAQIGAAIGREFNYELVAAVAPMPREQLDEALIRLSELGLAFRQDAAEAVYTFKMHWWGHGLLSRCSRAVRQELHGRIARVIERRFPNVRTFEPGVLAHHCEEAGLTGKAVCYWLEAGRQDIARFAMTEAISQLRRGLALVSTLPDNTVRQAQELDLTSMLGHALMATQGFSSQKSGNLFDRSRRFCEQLAACRS